MEKQRRKTTVKVVEKAVIAPDVGKLPPQARELEEAVLGALMLEKDAYSVVSEILRPESFYDPSHQLIYGAIQGLSMQQEPVDVLTVVEELKRRGELETAGGALYIAELSDKVASAAHVEYHARIIAQKFLARELISFSSEVSQHAFDETVDVDDLMQETEGRLFEISQRNVKKDVIQINPIIKEAFNNIQIAANRKDGMSGLPTGFTQLDKLTAGWQNSDLIIIAARPAMGKTAFALSMAKNMALDYNVPVGIFSLEMANVQLVNRLIINVCQIRGESIKSGRLTEDEWERLENHRFLYNAPIYIDDTPSLSVFELRTKARRLVREHKVKAIMIDYLQLMNASGMNFGNREHRGVETRQGTEGKRPQLADLRESGAIEQDADIVCFIHRPEYYRITEDDKGNSLVGIAEIIVAKHRNGPTGIAIMRFDGEYARFQNLDANRVGRNYVERPSRMNHKVASPKSRNAVPAAASSDALPANDEPL